MLSESNQRKDEAANGDTAIGEAAPTLEAEAKSSENGLLVSKYEVDRLTENLNTLDAAEISTIADAIRAETEEMDGCQEQLVQENIKDPLDLVNTACARDSCQESLQELELFHREAPTPPLVSLRPASSTDAWFILNLLSAVPFLSG
jgi:hypothetical protein